MSRSIRLAIIPLVLLVAGSTVAPAQDQVYSSAPRGLPNLSGWDIVNRYSKPPADPTSLRSICDARRAAIADAESATRRALAAVDESADPVTAARLNDLVGQVCLYKGDVDGAIARFESVRRIASANAGVHATMGAAATYSLAALGVASLRRGEVENCAEHHTADMGIFPLSAAARHTKTNASEEAVRYFEAYLARDPGSLEVRWLLNVAYQTLGQYPDKAPAAYLIPPAAFASQEDVGRFVDVAPSLGLDAVGNAGGAIVDDFDNDGDFDIVESGVDPCESIRMFANTGDGTFEDVTARSRLSEQAGGINCTQTDYNNDGWLDIYVMRGGWEVPMRNSLLRNNRDGTFTDVTAASGLLAPQFRTQSAAWADYNNDGWVDLFVGHELAPSQLFRNRGDGTFEDVSAKAGVDQTSFAKGVVWGDYDDDGFPDLYVSNFMEDNLLYHNNGNGTFDEVATELGVERPLKSFPAWFWDYDNDGRLDLFVSSYTFAAGEWVRPYLGLAPHEETMKLYRNTGNGGFADVTNGVGLDRGIAAMGANYGDLDNDGFLDFYAGTGTPSYGALMPNLMFRNHDGKYFVDVTTSTGTGHLQKGHGVSFADVDNDGNEDVYANVGGAVLGDKYNKVLFENPGHTNDWISIKLVGVKSNRAAIGAKIKITLASEGRAGAIRFREVSNGGSFGANPLTQHIGLGADARIATVEVRWPASGTRQVFTDVGVNQFVEIRELEKTYRKRTVRKISLKLRPPAPHAGHR